MTLAELVNKIGFKVDTAGLQRASDQIKSFQDSIKNSWREIMGAAMWSAPIFALDALTVKTAASMEDLRTKFKVLLQDEGKAFELTKEIIDYAGKTPYSQKDISDANAQMLSFGITLEQVGPDIKAIGDIAMGNVQSFKGLSLAFSQASAVGKLMGQDLLQMINAGFNPLKTMSEDTGKSIAQLKDEMSRGLITFDMVRDAFQSATSEGGQFYKGAEEGAKTFSGVMNTFKDNVSLIVAEIGVPLLDPLKKILNTMIDFFQKIRKNLNPEVSKSIMILLNLVAVLPMVVIGFKLLAGAAKMAGVSVARLGAILLGKVLIWVALIGGLFLLVEDFLTWLAGGESFFEKIFGSPEKAKEVIEKIKEMAIPLIATFETIISSAKNAFSGLMAFVVGVFTNDVDKATDGFYKFIDAIIEGAVNALFIIFQALEIYAPPLLQALGKVILNILKVLVNVILSILKKAFSDVWNWILDDLKKGIQALPAIFPGKKAILSGLENMKVGLNVENNTDKLIGNNPKQSIINVDSAIQISVPEGTSEYQQKFLQDSAKTAVGELFQQELNKLYYAGGY